MNLMVIFRNWFTHFGSQSEFGKKAWLHAQWPGSCFRNQPGSLGPGLASKRTYKTKDRDITAVTDPEKNLQLTAVPAMKA